MFEVFHVADVVCILCVCTVTVIERVLESIMYGCIDTFCNEFRDFVSCAVNIATC